MNPNVRNVSSIGPVEKNVRIVEVGKDSQAKMLQKGLRE